MALSRQEYWSGLPFAAPGDLPDQGIEPASLASPALESSFPIKEPGHPLRQFEKVWWCILLFSGYH